MRNEILKIGFVLLTLLIIALASPMGQVIENDISNHTISNELIVESFILLLGGIAFYCVYSIRR